MSATPALPVLVDCAPYHTRLTMSACAQRYTIAGGGTWKKGDPAGAAAIASSSLRTMSLCKGCPVGAARAAELGAAAIEAKLSRKPGTVSRRKAPRLLAELARAAAREKATRERLAHPQAGPTPATKTTNEGKAMAETRKCEECGDSYEAKRRDQRFCSKDCLKAHYKTNPPPSTLAKTKSLSQRTAKPARRADVSTRTVVGSADATTVSFSTRPQTPFEVFVALNVRLDERKRVAAESIREAEDDIAKFVLEHGDVVADARAKVERWAAARATSPDRATPPEIASPAGASPAPEG